MKIEKFKKRGSKYKLILDNGDTVETYEDVIIKYNLLFSKNINNKLLEKINNDTIYYKGYNKALDMINRRIRSEYEIREILKKNDVSSDNIDLIVTNLKKINILDDRLYAKAYANDKINLSLDGPYKIKKHLEENKINLEYIEEAISSIDKNIINAHIDKVIIKKINSNNKYTAYILKQKIINYLVNLGYSKNSVINRLDNFEIESKGSTREMNKIYDKLKRKYDGSELILHLRNKLYSRGYSASEISDYIESEITYK